MGSGEDESDEEKKKKLNKDKPSYMMKKDDAI